MAELENDLAVAHESFEESIKKLDEVNAVVENIDTSIRLLQTYGQSAVAQLNLDSGLEELLGVPEQSISAAKAIESLTALKTKMTNSVLTSVESFGDAMKSYLGKINEMIGNVVAIKFDIETFKGLGPNTKYDENRVIKCFSGKALVSLVRGGLRSSISDNLIMLKRMTDKLRVLPKINDEERQSLLGEINKLSVGIDEIRDNLLRHFGEQECIRVFVGTGNDSLEHLATDYNNTFVKQSPIEEIKTIYNQLKHDVEGLARDHNVRQAKDGSTIERTDNRLYVMAHFIKLVAKILGSATRMNNATLISLYNLRKCVLKDQHVKPTLL